MFAWKLPSCDVGGLTESVGGFGCEGLSGIGLGVESNPPPVKRRRVIILGKLYLELTFNCIMMKGSV